MPVAQKKQKAQPALFDGVSPKKKRAVQQANSEWASKALNSQGDLLLGIMSAAMKEADITRMSIEAIDKALVKAKHDFEAHHIRAAIKNLTDRELLARDGYTYLITKQGQNVEIK